MGRFDWKSISVALYYTLVLSYNESIRPQIILAQYNTPWSYLSIVIYKTMTHIPYNIYKDHESFESSTIHHGSISLELFIRPRIILALYITQWSYLSIIYI